MEQNARPAADSLFSASISDNPKTRLKILITASIAGERTASVSSLPDTSTYEKYKKKLTKLSIQQKLIHKYIKVIIKGKDTKE